MTKAIPIKGIEQKAARLAELSIRGPVIDMEQLARFSLIDEQIANFGITELTNMSDEEFLRAILGED